MIDRPEHLPVYILAGGESRRFGSDKAAAMLRGRPLILHVAGILRPWASALTVVAERAEKYDALGLRTIGDLQPGLGPLGGLATALGDCRSDWLLLAPCDFVNFDPRWVQALLTAPRQGAGAVAFKSNRWQPMPALYHRKLAPLVDGALSSRRLSMQRLLDEADTAMQPLPKGWPTSAGVNTAQELRDLGG
jgi:molybdenum cofactor guanylyltransferase